jgi:PAS domain S-box-containing protein
MGLLALLFTWAGLGRVGEVSPRDPSTTGRPHRNGLILSGQLRRAIKAGGGGSDDWDDLPGPDRPGRARRPVAAHPAASLEVSQGAAHQGARGRSGRERSRLGPAGPELGPQRPVRGRAAAAVTGLPPRLRRFIAVVVAAGAVASTIVVATDPGRWDGGVAAKLAVLLALTAASELGGLRLRHRGEVEVLTLYEGMVVVNIALLPAGQAMAVSLAGFLVAQVVQARPPVKVAFNLGMYATALGPAIGVYHAVADPGRVLAAPSLGAMAAAVAVFALLNLVLISQLLAAIEGRPVREVLRESSKTSILVFLGNSSVGLIGVALWLHVPVMLPSVLLPVATLYLAYRSAARETEERDRFQHLYEVGQALSSSLVLDDVLPDVLPRVAELFRAGEARLLFAQGAGRPFGAIYGAGGFRFGPASDADLAALRMFGDATAPVTGGGRRAPAGWREVLAAPLVAQGRHHGVILLGNLAGPGRRPAGLATGFSGRDLQLLSPLASGLAVTLSNATQVAQLKEEKSKLERILGLSSDGILLLDGKGRVRLWNEAMEHITGVPAEDAVGLAYNEWLAGPDPSGARVTLEDLLAGTGPANPRASAEVRIPTREGLERWLRCNHSLLFEGGAWTTDVVIVHDVTAIRQTERLKADFVATVSHELRTPITPIKGYVELLRSKGAMLAEDKRQEMLRVIAERAEHMARLIEDLLLASRISSGRPGSATPGLHLERTDLAAAARKAAADWLRDPASRLTLELPGTPMMVEADSMRLSQILANLLSNAHKYSLADQPVVLALAREGGWARASVVDRGRGIPRDELERVFDKFHRVEDPMTMTTGGTGLGLYIARELARAMGGEIEAASLLHHGSTFTLRLPLAEPALAAAAGRAGAGGAGGARS